jgi:hypothetical protein
MTRVEARSLKLPREIASPQSLKGEMIGEVSSVILGTTKFEETLNMQAAVDREPYQRTASRAEAPAK